MPIDWKKLNNERGDGKLILFHGSENVVPRPMPHFGNMLDETKKRACDYGQGFYCTEDDDLERQWACKRNRDGWLNAYSFDLKDLMVLDLGRLEDNYIMLGHLRESFPSEYPDKKWENEDIDKGIGQLRRDFGYGER